MGKEQKQFEATQSCGIRVQNLTRAFGGRQILHNLDLELQPREIHSIIGPSGTGKTTLLRILAGLDEPNSGLREFLPAPAPGTLPALMVYQDHQLFPHMTVFDNVAFGPRARKWARSRVQEEVGTLLEQMGLSHRLRAYPPQLSGGEKQRCALARALVLRPPWLMMDEPFASLDPNLKRETALFLGELARNHGLGLLLVTHDFPEAFLISDRVSVMLEGRLHQSAKPQELLASPVDAAVAAFLGVHASLCRPQAPDRGQEIPGVAGSASESKSNQKP